MRALALLAFVPALAFSGDWSTAAPASKPGSFQAWATSVLAASPLPDHAGEPIVVEELPECTNPGCACLDCQCHARDGVPCQCVPNFGRGVSGQGLLDNSPAPTGPPLKIVVWDTKHCPHGERAVREIVPSLTAAGWDSGDYEIVRSDYGQCPQFYFRGEPFSRSGYPGLSAWLLSLRQAMGLPAAKPVVRVTNPVVVAQPIARPATVMRSDYHVHVCRRCGNSWSHHDSNSGSAAAHRCARCGNYEYLIRSQSGPAPAGYSQPAYRQPSYRYQPTQPTQQRGFFGRLFGGGCPGGACP
ncbi:MAG: hypothetical protein WBC44_09450 [Planctomycetaceae bacterium]